MWGKNFNKELVITKNDDENFVIIDIKKFWY